MVNIEVIIDDYTRVKCTWNNFGRECIEEIEIKNEQIPELIKKLNAAMESTGIITIEPKEILTHPCVTCGHAEYHTCPLFGSGDEPRYNAMPKTKFLSGGYSTVAKLNYPCYITFGEWEEKYEGRERVT